MNLLKLAQDAMPELNWSTDKDGDPIAQSGEALATLFGKEGVTVACHFMMRPSVVGLAPVHLEYIAAKDLNLHFEPMCVGYRRFWTGTDPTPEDVAQFYKDVEDTIAALPTLLENNEI